MAPSLVPLALAAPSTLGDVHLVVTGWLDLNHTIRHADGSWQPFGSLPRSKTTTPASVLINGEEHLFFRYGEGMISPYYYGDYVRHPDGSWSQEVDPGGIDATQLDGQAATELGGGPALVRRDGDELVLSVQRPTAPGWAGKRSRPRGRSAVFRCPPGVTSSVSWWPARTARPSRPTTVRPAACGRRATGRRSAGVPRPTSPSRMFFADLEVVAVAHSGTGVTVRHSILHSDFRWDLFRFIFEGAAAGAVPAVDDVAVAASRGAMQLVVAAQGGLYHTIRRADGSWQRFGDITREAGKPNVSSEVSLAGDEYTLPFRHK
ncbi:hypothetical protein [Kutzneria sp. 744]|uniref:hypothetical protein n=1 Tax=Kutzneria sp. (strain 744) TaxID=345341 RepID=UPI0003EEB7EA|nr:hypothetical protein [Kutzneria sp. 744]EWM10170.1 hypothetical protein KUTG_00474 [Kutzneria sp. 744]